MKKAKAAIYVWAAVCLAACLALASGCTTIRALLGKAKSADPQPHLITEAEKESNPSRPIDVLSSTRGFSATTLSDQFDELLEIVYAGADGGSKPDFTDALDGVEGIYNTAVGILNRYIRNDFSEYERVHAIHDYLAYYVAYDFALLESDNIATDDPSFRLDGVFVHHKAVCDGFSKAFALLCGIEQIRCIRVTGVYDLDGTEINHAWNKVNVSGRWYNVDASMDAWHVYTDSSSTPASLLNHGYFLISDDAIRETLTGRHKQSADDPVNYACTDNYNFHAVTALGVGSYSMEIKSQEQLNDVFTQVKKSKRKIGKIEVKLNFADYDASNLNREDAYVTQIAAAYKKVNDADFAMDAANKVYPYQRYPNGVFVFLIYK